ncbi:MAG: hypothetical protein JWM59_4532 [Verrucomicrobiales bacterium]|nr:hypothetical protein [Verrucomicrobiales bacterium]
MPDMEPPTEPSDPPAKPPLDPKPREIAEDILPPAEPSLARIPPVHPVPERDAPVETVATEILTEDSTPVEPVLTETTVADSIPQQSVAWEETPVEGGALEVQPPASAEESIVVKTPGVDSIPEQAVTQEPVPVKEPAVEEPPPPPESAAKEVPVADFTPGQEVAPAERVPPEAPAAGFFPGAPVVTETSRPEPAPEREAVQESIPAQYIPETDIPPAVSLVKPVLLETLDEQPVPEKAVAQEPVPAEEILPAASLVEPAALETLPEPPTPERITSPETVSAEEAPEAVTPAAAAAAEPVEPAMLETPAVEPVWEKAEPVIAPAVAPVPVETAAAATTTVTTAAVAVGALPVAVPGTAAPGVLQRLTSVDAYRGFVMLLMMGEVLGFSRVAQALPDNETWRTLAFHWEHVDWTGCTLHDLIQPSFTFLVGVALPFSLARRAADGQPEWKRTVHAFWRALLLVLLGVFLRSTHSSQTNWTFEDTLSQIGLGYGFLYILALKRPKMQWITLASLLGVYWLAFAIYRVPSDSEPLTGFASHWNLNANPAWAFDRWFLNLFPREQPFVENGGGYSTLSFIPTLGTMILGLLAGNVLLRGGSWTHWKKLGWLIAAGLIGLGAGWGLDALGVCPVVKRIWTPSWVLFSGGWAFLFLAAFYLVMEIAKLRRWAFVLTVVGMNSIAAYLIAHLFQNFISKALPRHFGTGVFELAGTAYAPFVHGLTVLVLEWLMLWWMFRRKVFLKI